MVDTTERVCEDLKARREKGVKEYGAPLSMDTLIDAAQYAYEESCDQTVYLRLLVDQVAALERELAEAQAKRDTEVRKSIRLHMTNVDLSDSLMEALEDNRAWSRQVDALRADLKAKDAEIAEERAISDEVAKNNLLMACQLADERNRVAALDREISEAKSAIFNITPDRTEDDLKPTLDEQIVRLMEWQNRNAIELAEMQLAR